MPTRDPPAPAGPTTSQLLACLDGVADGVIIGDAQGNVTYWNPAALRLHGYAAPVRKHLSQFADTFTLTPPDGRPVPLADWPFARLVRGEAVSGFEAELGRTDTDHRRVLHYDGAVVETDVGGPRQIVLTIRDLTEQRRAERRLRQSQSDFQELIESLPQLVWTCRGTDGACDYVSPQFARHAGLPAERLRELGWVSQVHADDRAAVAAGWAGAIAGGAPFGAECRLRGADGAFRWFEVHGVPLRDAGGRVSRWIGTCADVHDGRLAAESRAVLAAIVDGSDDAIVGKTLDGTITSWNRAAHRMFGYAADEAVGRNVTMLLPADRAHEERDILARVGAGESVDHFESQRVAKDGRLIDVSLTISPIRDSAGRVVGASKIARDVTAHRAAAEKARERQAALAHLERVRTVSHMAAGLAHELDQPFGAIANYAAAARRMVASGGMSAEGVGAVLADIGAEAARAGAIVQRLRGFVQKQQPHVSAIDVNDVVAGAVQLLAFDLRQTGIAVRTVLAAGLPPAMADAVQVGQVLVNLIRNAIDAMGEVPANRRRLTIGTELADRFVRVTVRDSGPGVPPATLAHIFDAFFTTKADGLGIGLSLCRTIVEDHGGHLSAEPNPDGGMTFAFTLRPCD
jgi:PAS domain S-box-containing protein